MHVVIVSRRFPPQIGGAEMALGRLAEALGRHGHRVSVLCEARHDEFAQQVVDAWRESVAGEAASGVHVVPVRTSSARFWGTLRWMQALSGTLNRLTGECDLIYVSMLKHSAYVAAGIGRRRGVPVVLRPSGTGRTGDVAWQDRSVHGRIFRRRCRKADALVAVSAQMRDELVAGGYPEASIRLIPGGVPVPETPYDPATTGRFRSSLSLDPLDAPLAVYVGRFSAEKGLADLVEAWARVVAVDARARLVLLGEGPMRERIEQQIRDQGLESSIRLCGATNDPEPFLRAADLFVLPSHHEGMSNALLEAMALGLPTVATNIPGNRAATAEGDCAALVPAHQPKRLADALSELFADPARRRVLGVAARERAAGSFNLSRVLDAHVELFEELRNRKGD